MKKLMLILMLLISVIGGAMAQSESLYIYKKNGTIISIPKSKIESVSCSKYDTDDILQDDYVTQIIVTEDSTCIIPLEEIDNVSLFAPDPEESISPAFVPIDWENASISSCDAENCSYSLSFSGDIPKIIPSSVIITNEDSISRIVLVTEVERNGNSLEIKGEYGDMSYLLFDTEFDVEGNGDVLKNYSDRRLQSKKVASKAVELSKEFKWEYPGKIDLYEKGGASSYIDYKSTITVTPSFKFSFGDKITTWKQGVEFIRAKNYDVDFQIKGDFDIEADLTAEFNSENTNIDLSPNQKDKYELVPSIKIPSKDIFVTIGALTVPIRIGGAFYKQTTLKVKNTHAKFTVGFDAKASGTIGYKYDGINETGGTPYVDFDFKKNLHNPYVEGNIDMEGRFYFFPRIHAWICDYTGPSVDIKPYLRTEITGGFRKDMLESSKSDYCAWSLTNAAGVDWALGWSTSVFFFDLEQSNKQLKNGTFTNPDWKLYESPKNIEFVSAEPKEIKKATPMEVRFRVLDKSFLGELPTCLPQLVKFESDKGTAIGNFFDGFSYAKDGIVTVKWLPGSNFDVLYARLYNKNGDVIAEAHYGDPIVEHSCPDNHHPHAIDLGLPSGTKWCCRNVGASKPEDFGGLYAWGETGEKERYTDDTYHYCTGSDEEGFLYQHIGDDITGTSYDVAHIHMGGSWRMPSTDQQQELVDYCTHTWTQQNGVDGMLFTGENGGQIFLPAAGFHGGVLHSDGSFGTYWSSSLDTNENDRAYKLTIRSGDVYTTNGARFNGLSVRAVCP